MKMNPLQELEQKLGLDYTYYFTVNRVKTFLDEGELEPLENDVDICLYSESSLKELAKQVKRWIEVKKAGFVEYYDNDMETFYLTFDTQDLTIYVLVHCLDQDSQSVKISAKEFEEFIESIGKK